MNGQKTPGRQHRSLDAFFTVIADEGVEVGEVPELLLIARGLRSRRQGLAHLGNQYADFVGRNLDSGELLHLIEEPPLETDTGHQKLRLIPGLALEGDGII